MSMTKNSKTDEQVHNDMVDAIVEKNSANAALTAEAVEARVGDLIAAASLVFFEPEQRILADNGKAYPLTYGFEGKDFAPTEDIVTVDKYGFLDKSLSRLQCSGLEMLLRQQDDNIEGQRKRIQNEIRFGRSQGADVEDRVNRMADWLEHMIEQRQMVSLALQAAITAHAEHTGDTYVTRANATKFAAAKREALGATGDRLKKLGVDA
jgi:hypothetical protein